MTLLQKTNTTIRKHRMFRRGDTVIVAVSGGPDSMALLNILHELSPTLGIQIRAAHVHHGLRTGAGRDEELVRKSCRALQIPLNVSTLKIPPTLKGSLEEIARDRRYQALVRIAKRRGAQSIALAHHQDDLAETVLMRILRGTGLQGLKAIQAKTVREGIVLVRPLIDVTRSEIEGFLKARKIKACTDPTNRQRRFFRNRIRMDLIPTLQQDYSPRIRERLNTLAETAGTDYDYILSQGERTLQKIMTQGRGNSLSLALGSLRRTHPAIQRAVLRLAIERLQGSTRRITAEHLRLIEGLLQEGIDHKALDLPGGLKVVKRTTTLRLSLT